MPFVLLFPPSSWTLSGALARLRSLWRGVRRRPSVEADMAEEFRHHIALRTEDLMGREGLPRKEAYRRARLEFGHVEGHREDARASRGLRGFDELAFSWLDVKLGLRMLRKYPGLTIIAVVGMAVAMAIGTGAFAFLGALLDADLPLPEGHRIVAIQNNTDDPGNPDRRALHDFETWRTELTTVRDVSAFMADRRNLILPGGEVALIRIALMTPSGFRVARVPPLVGRYLTEADAPPGAPPVLVMAYEEWQRRFGGDPEIVGRTVRVGDTPHTVVGVMPEGYRFPLSHRYWAPLRLDPSAHPRGGGPALNVFGRLAAGQSLRSAQAELTTVGSRLAAEYPETNARLRPVVLPYPHMFTDIDSPFMKWLLRGFRMAVGLLLVIVAANVGVLVYARTTTRVGEIAVRSALGASRRRVVTQLFAEGMVLSLLSAGLGLGIGALGLAKVNALLRGSIAGEELPFWIDLGVSADEVLFVATLALVAGAIVGVLPALTATGRSLYAALKPAGGSRGALGRTWTGMIVVQVALAVALLPFALYVTVGIVGTVTGTPGYPADELVRGYLSIERLETPPADRAAEYEQATRARYAASGGALLARLESDPAVVGATFSAAFPGEERYRWIEVEGRPGRVLSEGWGRVNRIAPDLPALFDFPIRAGRGFRPADTLAAARAVIVDRAFVARLLDGAGAVGRRVRVVERGRGPNADDAPGPWLEVVGVADVPDLSLDMDPGAETPRLYQPVGLADLPAPVTLSVRTRGAPPAGFAGRLRELTATVDPRLQLHELRAAADVDRTRRQTLSFLALGIAAVTLSVLLLSAAGIYAMMSFTVARRRREIGIRSALGADPRRLLAGIFRRAASQIGGGVAAGMLLAAAFARVTGSDLLSGGRPALILAVVVIMAGIGLLATLGPARRGLAVQPTEALREE